MKKNNSYKIRNLRWFCALVISLFFCLVASASEPYFVISSTQECGDLQNGVISVKKLRQPGANNVIVWNCKGCELESQILLKRLNKISSKDVLLDTLETVPVKCYTPKKTFVLKEYTSFVDMGLTKREISRNPITLTLSPEGKPLAMYIGRPFISENNIAPTIIPKAGNDVFFCRGEVHSFEASVPYGISEDEAYYRWYIDGVEMTGRNDRWFDTYSRTNWVDGEHVISCDVSIGKNGKRSPRGKYQLVQLPGHDCSFSIRAIPYWGADCESDAEASDFRYNEKKQWGSILVSPIEEYVHFYMEIINKKILTSTITNDPQNKNFQLVQKSEVDVDYAFFLLPANFKAHAKEPFTPTVVYFKIEGTNINFSMLPYTKPSVSVLPDSVSVCERAFEREDEREYFVPKVTGFDEDSYVCKWFYSETEDGDYRYVETLGAGRFFPNNVGYYKVLVTDGVFEAWSKPMAVHGRTDNCNSVSISSVSGADYTCKNETLLLKASPDDEGYTYQWKVGSLSGENLREVRGANKNTFKATISNQNEAWFVEVTKGNVSILSNPFVVRKMPELPNYKKMELAAFPNKVCSGRSALLEVRFHEKARSKATDSTGYIYEWYKVENGMEERINTTTSVDLSSSINDVINRECEYYVVVKGCDGIIRSPKKVKVDLNRSEACSSGEIYVNALGDDRNDGLSWETAYASIDKAVLSANEFRNTAIYSEKPIFIKLSGGVYYPSDDNEIAYEVPTHTSIIGGYDSVASNKNVKERIRNPKSPANAEGNLTMLKTNHSNQRLFKIKNGESVHISGLWFDGESVLKKSALNGRAILIENSSVDIDSCVITGFYADKNEANPLTAVSLIGEKNNVNISNTTFMANMGGQVGSCLGILSSGTVNINKCTFTNNTTQYYGGVAVLSYNSSPTVNIINSTFFDNTCPEGLGYFGRSVIRMVGGNPIFNIYASTVSDRFYKEDGKLSIYNSILESAGKADVYENNYPTEPSFSEEEKNIRTDNLKFLSNFKGTTNKLHSEGGFTQVMIPTNRIGIVGKAGAPVPAAKIDQRGYERNLISSTFGAYEQTYSVAIKCVKHECGASQTRASFISSVSGLTNVEYQWVNNYSDVEGAKGEALNNVGIGTYWLEVSGTGKTGEKVSLRSNEIRIFDVCSDPGVYYVKTPENGGDDNNSGNTWNQPFATIEKALEVASAYSAKNKNVPITINVAAGNYEPTAKLQELNKNANNTKIIGSYPANADKGDIALQKDEQGLFSTKVSLKKMSADKSVWGNIDISGLFCQ